VGVFRSLVTDEIAVFDCHYTQAVTVNDGDESEIDEDKENSLCYMRVWSQRVTMHQQSKKHQQAVEG